MDIYVEDGNIEKALKVLKRYIQREGVLKDVKRKSFYEKPSERERRKAREARKGDSRWSGGNTGTPKNRRAGPDAGAISDLCLTRDGVPFGRTLADAKRHPRQQGGWTHMLSKGTKGSHPRLLMRTCA